MGVQQALGLVIVEFYATLFDEIHDMYKNGFLVDDKHFFDSLIARKNNIYNKVQNFITQKYPEIIKAFGSGFIAGAISNLVTNVINIFYPAVNRKSGRYVRMISLFWL
ncbi:hypothetical protein [Helicobacter didelphidarum]|nr:hypothetical protein [Helicobacter didelphidarum]